MKKMPRMVQFFLLNTWLTGIVYQCTTYVRFPFNSALAAYLATLISILDSMQMRRKSWRYVDLSAVV